MKTLLPAIVIASFFILFSSCEPKSGQEDNTKDTITRKQVVERRFYSGNADKPANDFQITSAGLGQMFLGDSLEKVMTILKPIASTIEEKGHYEGGKEWPSKMIILHNGYFISVAMVNTIDLVTAIHTNDPSFKSRNNIHAGQSLDSLNLPLDSIKSDYEHRSFSYGSEGVWFKVNKNVEDRYFKSNAPTNELLKGAKIEEMYIVCGDC